MQLQFHGAVRTVTGSQHLLRVNGKQILLDCGLYQGKRKEAFKRNRHLPFKASDVDVCVLSHAHIDHSGNIPNLVKSGFRGDIVCTYATRDLCNIMLRDSGHIQESDIRYVNKWRRKKGQDPLEPNYTERDAIAAMNYFLGMAYDRTREILPGVWLTFIDGGHILGSATVVLDIEDQDGERDVRVVFSGDIGRNNRPILRDPQTVDRADILLIESTYGNREHKIDAVSNDELFKIINETADRRGKVIVPSFSVGRTQELVYRIHQGIHSGDISAELPIFVDSPLAINATSVYRLHPEAYDEELERFMLADKDHSDPFGFDRIEYTRTVEQSKRINTVDGAAVIISASGMAENGRILHHLRNNIEDPNNTILIVGWQAPNTLGRRIVEKQPEVKVFGHPYKLRAQVSTINGFCGHADRSELLDWVGAIKQPPRQTFLVHGDEQASLDFQKSLGKVGLRGVHVPTLGQTFQV